MTRTENCGSHQIAGLLIEMSERDRIEVVGLRERKINESICIYWCGSIGLADHNP